MRIAVAVDWSDQAFSTVQNVFQLYQPQEIILIHAVDLHPFENPLLAPVVAKQAFEEFRQAMLDRGRKLMGQMAALVPGEGVKITRRMEVGRPAAVILDVLNAVHPDLMVIGSRGRARLTEAALGSVSHRVLLHAACSTLVMKQPVTTFRRVLVAIEGSDDAAYVQEWLSAYPFKQPVDLSILCVVPVPQAVDAAAIPAFDIWQNGTIEAAQNLVKDLSVMLRGSHYLTTGHVLRGDPADVIVGEAGQQDLVVVGSHARHGLQRFLLGSVSHAVNHRVACPVLIVRKVI
jgi:nucleotide-binding universal stress UspA family protein